MFLYHHQIYRYIEQLYLRHNTTGETVSQMCEHRMRRVHFSSHHVERVGLP